jgi:tRNA pseudouridine55 synthase
MKDGIVLIDKPLGWTSFDVVAKIRGILKKETGLKMPKVGHTGTLDPQATGLLVIVVGKYCKRAQEFSKLDKEYQAELTLGYTSSTEDNEGEKTKISDKVPGVQELEDALNKFVGTIQQTPPAFSAIKIDGQRAYKLARDGKQVEMKSREVQIIYINNLKYDYPKVCFDVKVSSGTYIRSLARDIGNRLETGAYLSGLRRTTVGDFGINNAIRVEEFNGEKVFEV